MRWANVVGVFSAVMLVVFAGAARAQTPATRPVIPSQADVAAALKTVGEAYADDFNHSKKPWEMLALSRKLQSAAQDEKDPASCFALLLKARDLGIQMGSFDQAAGVIDAMAQRFDLDVLAIKWDVAMAVARTAVMDQRIELGMGVKQLTIDALREDRYDIAAPAAQFYSDMAGGDLLVEARILIARVRETETGYNTTKSALAALQRDPANADANFVVGEFKCFYKGDWNGGLPMLAMGSDPVIKDVATREMANPADPVDVMKLADGWWKAGKDETGIVHAEILFHAGQLYDRASAGLIGLDKVKAETRWQEAMALHDLTSGTPASVVTNTIGMRFVRIQPGTFLMGSPAEESGRSPNETQHKVTLTKGFLMGTAPVTVGEYALFMNETGYQTLSEVQGYGFRPNQDNPDQVKGLSWKKPGFEQGSGNPVVEVTWNDAVAFCDWLSNKEGKTYRLPTEAEWEYAARAGTQTAYFFGDDVSMADEFTWNTDDAARRTYPAGEKRPNPWGLFDMGGNVYQWCSDLSMDYSAADVTDPTGATGGTDHVRRGSSWNNTPAESRCAARFGRPDSWRINNIGFRVVVDVAESMASGAAPLPAGPNGAGVMPGTEGNGTDQSAPPSSGTVTAGPPTVNVTAVNISTGALALDNKTDAAEGGDVLSRVAANYPRMVKGYTGARLVEYRDGIADPHAGKNTLMTAAGSYAKQAIFTDQPGNPAIWGFMDSTLDPGKYMIVFRIQNLSSATKGVCGLEFKNSSGSERLVDREIFADEFDGNNWSDLPIVFDLSETTKTRYQIWAKGHGIALDRIYIFKLTNDIPAPGQKAQEPAASTFTNSLGMKMVRIEPGTFMMGSPESEKGRWKDEVLHKVTLTRAFFMQSTPVTVGQFKVFVKDSGYVTEAEQEGWANVPYVGKRPLSWLQTGFDQTDDSPVVCVSWNDAEAFCKWVSGKERKLYHLPTEAEWEYSARSGTQTAYYFGDDAGELNDYAWWRNDSGDQSHPVGLKKPNAWGLYDMQADVFQWCADLYGPYPDGDAVDPQGAGSGEKRVMRGSAWCEKLAQCRTAHRSEAVSDDRGTHMGFRVVVDTEETRTNEGALAQQPWDDRPPSTAPPANRTGGGAPATTINSIGMKLVRIAPGTFVMGSPKSEDGHGNDEIQHKVTLTRGFFMAATPVTIGQFSAFANDTGFKTDAEREGWSVVDSKGKWSNVSGASWRKPGFDQEDDHPVVDVSWNDSVAFCKWLSKKEGKHYRLPTEAEWEYSARAGTQTAYYFGDDPSALSDYEWWEKNSGNQTQPVGQKKPNAWGLYDMTGNVRQWCQDWYGEYPQGEVTDPRGPDSGQARTERGGTWDYGKKGSRPAGRGNYCPICRNNLIGFRVVMDGDAGTASSPPNNLPASLPPPSSVGGTDQPGPSGGAIPPPGKSIFDDGR